MVIRQKRVRKSRMFSPRFIPSRNPKREVQVSRYAVCAVKMVLFLFLLFASYQSYVLMELKASHLPWFKRYALPLVFLAIAIIVLRSGLSNIKSFKGPENNRRGRGSGKGTHRLG